MFNVLTQDELVELDATLDRAFRRAHSVWANDPLNRSNRAMWYEFGALLDDVETWL